MLGDLTTEEIDHLMNEQLVGRLACVAEDQIFVVPITFAYDGKDIYAHSAEGSKVTLMRKNNRVCLQVDKITSMRNWSSVIVWGEFEELESDDNIKYALNILEQKIGSMEVSETAVPPRQTMSSSNDRRKRVVFRIRVNRKTGRFERN